jgi:hypothetical protein
MPSNWREDGWKWKLKECDMKFLKSDTEVSEYKYEKFRLNSRNIFPHKTFIVRYNCNVMSCEPTTFDSALFDGK